MATIGAQLNAFEGAILGPNRDCTYDIISPTVNFIIGNSVGLSNQPIWLPDGTIASANGPAFFGVCDDAVVAPVLGPTILILLATSDPLQIIASASASSASLVTQQVVTESEYPAPSFFIRKRSKALIRVEASR